MAVHVDGGAGGRGVQCLPVWFGQKEVWFGQKKVWFGQKMVWFGKAQPTLTAALQACRSRDFTQYAAHVIKLSEKKKIILYTGIRNPFLNFQFNIQN
jgi:hypothetical protein